MAKVITAYTPVTAGFHSKSEINAPMLIDEYIDKVGTGLVGPYICVVNENPMSRVHWDSYVLKQDDTVLFLAFPQGGGEGGSNPVQTVALIAIMAASMAIPGMAIFAGTMFAAGTFGGALVSASVMFGGSYLVNLAFPPEKPKEIEESLTRQGTSLSSYNLNDRGNVSALNNVITTQYGRIKHYPKYAMQSWSKFIDNEQYGYLLFCQGQGEYSFEEFNFGTVNSGELSSVDIVTFDSNDILPDVDGETFYDNVFTSEQVQNIEVRRVDDYEVEVPGSIDGPITVVSGEAVSIGIVDSPSTFGLITPNSSKYDIFIADLDQATISNSISSDGSFDITNKVTGAASFHFYMENTHPLTETLPIGTVLESTYPISYNQCIYINGDYTPADASDPLPITSGIRGRTSLYDGFVAGDKVKITEQTGPSSSFTSIRNIKSSFYYTDKTYAGTPLSWVAYEFAEAAHTDRPFGKGSVIELLPSDASNGYTVPNKNLGLLQKGQADISFPSGIYKVDELTGNLLAVEVSFAIEYKEINSSGTESVWYSVDDIITAGTRSPINKTYDLPINTPSTTVKLKVRVNKVFAPSYSFSENATAMTNMAFVGLKAVLPNTNYYGNVTMIASKVKVSNSLISTSLSKFNTVSTRKLPIYTASWSSPTATRNPAWAIADACRNSNYSVAMPDSQLDIDELVTLAATWAGRNDYCDGLFESKEVFWDALRKICKVGRAQPLSIAGQTGFVRDQKKTLPKQMFGSDNILFDSFSVDYVPFDDDTPTSVELEYFDEEDWIWKKTLQTISGGSTDQPAKIQQWGITTEAHATRDAKWNAACNAYRRKLPSFTTELEGRILKRLDLISVSSPRIGWGVSGHVVAVDGNNLELSEVVEFTTGDHYITLREKNGSQEGPYLVTEVTGEPKKVLMSATPPSFIYTGYEYEKTMFQFGQGTSYNKECLVATVQPQQLESVQITCIVDDDRVYTADGTSGS